MNFNFIDKKSPEIPDWGYVITLLELIAWELSAGNQEFSDFRKRVKDAYNASS